MNKFYKADKAFRDYIKKRDIHNGYFICPTCNMKNNALQADNTKEASSDSMR